MELFPLKNFVVLLDAIAVFVYPDYKSQRY